MISFEDRLSELLHQAAPRAREVSFEEVARRARRRVVRARASASAVAALAAATVIAAGIAAFGPGSRVAGSGPAAAGPARHTGDARNLIGPNGNLYPLGPSGMAEKTTVAGAQAKAGFPVAVPRTPAASLASLTQVWVNTYGEVALVFDKGKVDITMHRATYQSAVGYFRAFVAEKDLNRVTAAIGQVNGTPALVITPNTDAYTHSNPAVVSFWRNGVFISIYSNSYGTRMLLATASSMR